MKKDIFWAKNWEKLSIRTKFDQFFPKKRFSGPKIVEKMEFYCQKLTNFPTKVKFWGKSWETIDQFKKKIVLFQRELKKIIPKGIKKVLLPKNKQNKSSHGPKM